MLILGINTDYNVYVCIFVKDLQGLHGLFNFNEKSIQGYIKYKEYMFTDITLFWNYVMEVIHNTMTVKCITELLTDKSKQEYFMLERIKLICNKDGLEYKRNQTINTIDCYINNIPIQAKNTYMQTYPFYATFSLHHNIRGNKTSSYNQNDPFEYVIFECSGSKENTSEYENNFYLIPKRALVYYNYISTDDFQGKTSISVCLPGHKYFKDQWYYKYFIPKDNFYTEFMRITSFEENRKNKLTI